MHRQSSSHHQLVHRCRPKYHSHDSDKKVEEALHPRPFRPSMNLSDKAVSKEDDHDHDHDQEREEKKETLCPCPFPGLIKLFAKVITKTDITQHRLAIPKHEAKKHFQIHSTSTSKDVVLFMKDSEGKQWRFRYTLWKSSRGYVLTSQWGRFVKEKGVSAGDVVSFLSSNTPDHNQLYIDWKQQLKSEDRAKSNLFEPGVRVQNLRLFGIDISTYPEIVAKPNAKHKTINSVIELKAKCKLTRTS